MNKSLIGILCGLGAASIWGGMYVVSKVVLETVPPFVLITSRLLLGAGTLAILTSLRGWQRLTSASFLQIFLVGSIGYGISLGFQFVGTKLSTASNGALVTSATPGFVFPLAAIILKERITFRKMVALLLSLIGVLAVINPQRASINPDLFVGNLYLVGAAITWALYSVLVRKLTFSVDTLTFSTVAFLGGLPICLTLGVRELSTQSFGSMTWEILLGILFLGVISTALAMVLWNTSFALLEASQAGLTFFAQPIVGSALSALFLKETLSPLFLLGGILILLALVLSNSSKTNP